MNEIWKDINGYEGYYQVSNLGRIKSLDRIITRCDGVKQFKKGGIKTPKNSTDGYNLITLSKNGKGKTQGIHIIVAKHFIPNPNNLPEVNHKDFNRKNNCANNLEWCTHQDNISYSSKQGRYKIRDFTGKNNPNYGNHVLAEIYANNPDFAKEKLSRSGKQNGHSCPVRLLNQDKQIIKYFDWMGECAKYLIDNKYTKASIDNVRDRIMNAIKKDKTYLGFYYERA